MRKLIIMIVVAIALLCGNAMAEETTDIWVLCSPESYVCLRTSPRRTANAIGGALCGTKLKTDGKTRNGYVHIVDLAAEEDSGWISRMYVVCDEPRQMTQVALAVSNGRLAVRKGVNGEICKWLKPMDRVVILYWTDEWCLTNVGYVMSEFLEFEGGDGD